MSFQALGLMPELLHATNAQGYTEPTPVQSQAIPHVLAGRDLLASAQTGTGKTAAFVLPILQRLATAEASSDGRARSQPVRCLVLTPTRELALQVGDSVTTYGQALHVRHATIYGGVGFEPQVRALRRQPEIVVATPGRLLDHVQRRTIDLRGVEVLVLDEADRMLDMGFIRDIRRILDELPAERQNLLFSATFSDEIRTLAAKLLEQPATVQATRPNSAVDLVRQVVLPVDRARKRAVLSRLIGSGAIETALVFTRTKHGADRLAEQLDRDGIRTAAIHGNKAQGQRIRALADFKAGRVQVLVATDIAARGLDIDALPHVVNYELPTVAADYIHRIGRTGRAGMEGDAVSLVAPDELPLLRDIERLLGRPIERRTIGSDAGRDSFATQGGRDPFGSDAGRDSFATQGGRDLFRSDAGRDSFDPRTAQPRHPGGDPRRRRGGAPRRAGTGWRPDRHTALPGERFRRPPDSGDRVAHSAEVGQRRFR